MKKSKVKKSVVALGIFCLLAALVWAMFYVALGAGLSECHFIGKHTLLMGKMFTFDFVNRTGPTIFTLIFGLAVLTTLVISIVVAKKKHRKVIILGWLYLLFAAYVAIELFANMTANPAGPENYKACGYVALLGMTERSNVVLCAFGVCGSAFLVLLLGICFWIATMLDARGKLDEKVDEEQVAAEKAQLEPPPASNRGRFFLCRHAHTSERGLSRYEPDASRLASAMVPALQPSAWFALPSGKSWRRSRR